MASIGEYFLILRMYCLLVGLSGTVRWGLGTTGDPRLGRAYSENYPTIPYRLVCPGTTAGFCGVPAAGYDRECKCEGRGRRAVHKNVGGPVARAARVGHNARA